MIYKKHISALLRIFARYTGYSILKNTLTITNTISKGMPGYTYLKNTFIITTNITRTIV